MASEQILPKAGVFKGMVVGDARVKRGSDLHIRGMISGNLVVEAGSAVLLTGMVSGKVINEGADLTINGMIGRR
jgi:hypothetical protein